MLSDKVAVMPAKNDYPLVSIIMPTYNRVSLIGETIESMISQTFSDWELLIIDDGSEDGTEQLIGKINDNRIIFHQAGRLGVGGKIKNIGLRMSRGEFIAFADSDDPWHETKMQKQLDVFREYPDAGFSLTGGYVFKTKGQPIEFFYKQKDGLRYDNLFPCCFRSEVAMFAQTLMIRRACIDNIGFFKEVKPFSDIDFIADLAYNFKGVILYEPLVFRRMHDDNYIHDNWEKSFREGIEFIIENKRRLSGKIANDALFRLYINYGEACSRKRNKGDAVKKFLNAWKNRPMSIIPFKKSLKAIIYPYRDS